MEEIKKDLVSNCDTQKSKPKTVKPKKNIDETNKTIIYIGPSIVKDGIISNTIFNNGLPENLKTLKEKCPIINNLLLEPSKATNALRQIQEKKGATYIAYEKVIEYVKMAGENNEL